MTRAQKITPWIVVMLVVAAGAGVFVTLNQRMEQYNNRRCAGLFAVAGTSTDSLKIAIDANCAWYIDERSTTNH